jgi:hypothetical protein
MLLTADKVVMQVPSWRIFYFTSVCEFKPVFHLWIYSHEANLSFVFVQLVSDGSSWETKDKWKIRFARKNSQVENRHIRLRSYNDEAVRKRREKACIYPLRSHYAGAKLFEDVTFAVTISALFLSGAGWKWSVWRGRVNTNAVLDPVYTRAKDSGFITKTFWHRIHTCVYTYSDESGGKSSRL